MYCGSCFDPEGGREAHNPSSSTKQARGARRVRRSLRFCGEAKLCSRRSAALSSCGNITISRIQPTVSIRKVFARDGPERRSKAEPLIGVSKREGPPCAHKPHEHWNTVQENEQYANTTPYRPPPSKTSSRIACASKHLHTRRLHAQRHPRGCISAHRDTHPSHRTHTSRSRPTPVCMRSYIASAPTTCRAHIAYACVDPPRSTQDAPTEDQNTTRADAHTNHSSWTSYIRMRMRTPSSRTTQSPIGHVINCAHPTAPQAHPAPLRVVHPSLANGFSSYAP
ncbi:hypothetical protein B0H13DRAFT_2533765 [Mycena leptocephala]|nr:hypothetical protein B0H13DRAFT_2533765 [Mycena leptocephala]